MEKYLKRLHEAYEKREARITDSMSRLSKRLKELESGQTPERGDYLFPEMSRDQMVSDMKQRLIGLQTAKEITAGRRTRRFYKSAIKSNEESSKLAPPDIQSQPVVNAPVPVQVPQLPIYTENDPRLARYGLRTMMDRTPKFRGYGA